VNGKNQNEPKIKRLTIILFDERISFSFPKSKERKRKKTMQYARIYFLCLLKQKISNVCS